jgi:ribosomal protein S12 methylthiotransferase
VAEIVEEAAWLLGRGVKELVLIGQDLGAYGRDLAGGSLLPGLFKALSAMPGDFRVRTLYIHPDNFPGDILPLMAADPRLLPYFDLPFQHASEPILRAMNRRGSKEVYLDLIRRIRAALPDSAIRSTFLVGFPGESEEDFQTLLAFQKEACLDWLGAFTYSREEGTPAYAMKGRVSKKAAEERKRLVEEAQVAITGERLARFVGAELEVLVEEVVETAEGEDGEEELSLGRAWLQAPDVDGLVVLRGRHAPGQLVRARVIAATGVDLDAIPIT